MYILFLQGNHFVKLEKWSAALESYSKAIEYNQNDPIFYANRALCYLKTKELVFIEY